MATVPYGVIIYGSLKMTQEQWERWSPRVGKICFWSFLLTFVGLVAYVAVTLYGDGNGRPALAVVLTTFFCGIAYWSALAVDPKRKGYRGVAEEASHCACGFDISMEAIARNKWLVSQSQEVQLDITRRVVRLVREVFSSREYKRAAGNFLVANITEGALVFLEENRSNLASYNNEELSSIIESVLRGVRDLDQAWKLYEDAKIHDKEKWEKIKKALTIIASPLLLVWWPVKYLVWYPIKYIGLGLAKLWEYTSTLYRLWQWFNKRCPFVTRPESMRLDLAE